MKTNISLSTLIVALFISFSAFAQVPEPVLGWNFMEDDAMGDVGDIKLEGGAKVTDQGLEVGNGKWASSTYSGSIVFKEKTLISVAKVGAVTGGGSILTMGDNKANIFDGLVLGERKAGHWFAGSDFFRRTDLNVKNNDFVEKVGNIAVIATTYKEVNGKCQVSVYRNGVLLETYEKGNIASFGTNTEFLFGIRHLFQNSRKNTGTFTGIIMGAVVFNKALNAAEIKSLSEEALEDVASVAIKTVSINANGQTIKVASMNAPDTYNWYEANEFCNNLNADGQDTWTLPTNAQLKAIFDNKATIGGTFPIGAFPNYASDYWALNGTKSDNAYTINFDNGGEGLKSKGFGNTQCRCVLK